MSNYYIVCTASISMSWWWCWWCCWWWWCDHGSLLILHYCRFYTGQPFFRSIGRSKSRSGKFYSGWESLRKTFGQFIIYNSLTYIHAHLATSHTTLLKEATSPFPFPSLALSPDAPLAYVAAWQLPALLAAPFRPTTAAAVLAVAIPTCRNTDKELAKRSSSLATAICNILQ